MTLQPRTYTPLDAFRYHDNGRVYVYLNEPGHRLPEEFVPAAEVDRLRTALLSVAAFSKHPHPAPCGHDACVLCLIESACSEALGDSA